jgi:hypothetical protein
LIPLIRTVVAPENLGVRRLLTSTHQSRSRRFQLLEGDSSDEQKGSIRGPGLQDLWNPPYVRKDFEGKE